jgi:hypothetical protein
VCSSDLMGTGGFRLPRRTGNIARPKADETLKVAVTPSISEGCTPIV